MADHHPARSSLGPRGPQWSSYAVVVARCMRAQTVYQPEFEDWLFHVLLPMAAYVTLAVSAIETRSYLREALFGVAAAALLLLFIGIHNAWDAVTYHVFVKKQETQESARTKLKQGDAT